MLLQIKNKKYTKRKGKLMKKKIISLLLVLVIVLSFASCFKDDIRYNYKDMSKYLTLPGYAGHVVDLEMDHIQQTIDSYIMQYSTTQAKAIAGANVYVTLKFTLVEYVDANQTIDKKGQEITDLGKKDFYIENLGNGSYNKTLEDKIIAMEIKYNSSNEVIVELPNEEMFGEYAGKKVYFSCKIDRACVKGDVVKVTYTGYYMDDNGNIKINDKGEKDKFDSASDSYFYLGSKLAIDDFENGIIGMRPGEDNKKEIKATFPEDYANEDLKGKTVIFDITVTAIMEVPEYNDKFVKDHLGNDTVEEFEKSLFDYYAENLMNEFLLEKTEFKSYPRREYRDLEDQFDELDIQWQTYYGMSYETYVKSQYGMTKKEYIQNSMQLEMIYYAIAKAENITPNKDQLEDAEEDLIAAYTTEYMNQSKDITEAEARKLAIKYIDQNLGTAVIYEEALVKLVKDFIGKQYTVNKIDPTYESVTVKK